MTSPDLGEHTMEFAPILRGSDALARQMRRILLSPYKIVLLAVDFLAVVLSFLSGAVLTHAVPSPLDTPVQVMTLLILSFTLLGFFPAHGLYNYHLIFRPLRHFHAQVRALGWGVLTLGIIGAFFWYPQFLGGPYLFPLVGVAAVGLLLLSRFLSNQLLNLLKSLGLCFLGVGAIALISAEEIPFFLENRATLPAGIPLGLGSVIAFRLFLVHVVFNNWMRRRFRRQITIVGTNGEAKRITRHVIGENAPYWITGFLGSKQIHPGGLQVSKDLLGTLKDLPRIVEDSELEEVIVTDEGIDRRALIAVLDYSTSQGLTVWFPPSLMPIIDVKLYIDSFCGLPMIRLGSQKNIWLFNKIKHGLDALVSLPAFLMLLPLFVLIGALIKRDSRGPVFYRAEAIGKNGEPFRMFKFRSMRTDTDNHVHKEYVSKLIKGELKEQGNEEQVFKVTDDPRITAVGRVLRKFSLDELPQIINVLKGEMSLVGPRPCLPYEYELYKDWHKKRMSVRPGITGLWQVAGRSAVAFEDMILLDLYYIYNRSLLMDLSIIYETLFAVVEKRGAY